jgi:hypothetical protein
MNELSGLDFARGLIRLGYRLTGNTTGFLLLERGDRSVTVPLCDRMSRHLFDFLLKGAGTTNARLFAVLADPSWFGERSHSNLVVHPRDVLHLRRERLDLGLLDVRRHVAPENDVAARHG